MFRALGALAMLPLIDLAAPYLSAVEADPARQMANFHTAFNLALGAVFLPFTGLMARLTERLLPQRQGVGELDETGARHLDDSAIDTPPVALACATRETMRMADIVETMLRDTIEVFRNNDNALLASISERETVVDTLQESIKLYLTRVSSYALDEQDSQRWMLHGKRTLTEESYAGLKVGVEDITVPAGTFTTDHLRTSHPGRGGTVHWYVSDRVPGGVVKFRWEGNGDEHVMTLKDFGSGATSSQLGAF